MTDEISPISMQDMATTTSWFRHAAPYIHAHRGATFIISVDGLAVASANFDNLIQDLALLNSLGIRLVIVYGARHQIEQQCQQDNIAVHYHQGLRVTDDASLKIAKAIVGQLRLEFEAKLSFSLPHTPMADAQIRCSSGNFVTAQPVGILEGVDLGHTGRVRRIDTQAIKQQLDLNNIVLLPPLGYSPTGEVFNLSAEAIATACASELKADKLIFIGDYHPELPKEMVVMQAEDALMEFDLPDNHTLQAAIDACEAGVKRVHLLNREQDDALLQELFTRDGAGILISATAFETTRIATVDDIGGILELIQPLERNGILVKRAREDLEIQIQSFVVMERDGTILACAALHPYPENAVGELACLAVSPDYRGAGRGEQLLSAIELQARKHKLNTLYVLTTQTSHWFLEQGFVAAELADLPVEKQTLYNYHRNAKIFKKALPR
jgi:amino-acid N-acetyltransferase